MGRPPVGIVVLVLNDITFVVVLEDLPQKIDKLAKTSPLTRRQQVVHGVPPVDVENIPAHAGTTARGCAAGEVTLEHPRLRGDNTMVFSESPASSGTSPLTRGQLPGRYLQKREPGNIPAYAGTTVKPRLPHLVGNGVKRETI